LADVFVSYSRRDAEPVQRLVAALQERGKDVWMDVDGIRDAEVFPAALRTAVEGSDGFVFVISPDSVASDFCEQEVEHAIELNKRIVPLVLRRVPDADVPEGLRVRNWIPFEDDAEFAPGVQRVVHALDTDLEWAKSHTRWLLKALEWEGEGRDKSFLLRGAELTAAEGWLATAAGKDPEPTMLQTEYALASRAAASRRQRTLAIGSLAVAVLSVALVVFALISRHQAASSRDRADISRLAAVSRSLVERQPDLGLLLAVAAFDLQRNEDTRGTLLNGLQANPLLAGLLHGVNSGLEAAVFSPDGRILATPTSDGTGTIVWSTVTHHRLAVLDNKDDIILDAAISPDGRWLAVPAIDETPGRFRGRLQIWDLERKRLVHLLPSPAGALSTATFTADGRSLFTQGGPRPGPFGTDVVTWNTKTWKPRGEPLVVNPKYVGDRSVAVSADGRLIAVPKSESGGRVEVWATATRRPVGELAGTAPVEVLAFSRDGKTLAVGDDAGNVRFFDPRSAAKRAAPISLSESSPTAIEFTLTGRRVAIGRRDGRTQIFDVASGEALGPPLAANAAAINDVSFTADGTLLATAGLDRTGALWRLDGNRAIGTELGGQGESITDAVFTPDGAEVLTASTDGSVAARDPDSGSIHRRFDLGGEALTAAVSPDGSTVAAGGTSGTVELWPARDPAADPLVVDLDKGWAQQIAYAPDGRTLAIAVDNERGAWEEVRPDVGHVRFVDPDTGKETAKRIAFRGGPPIGVEYSPDGDILAVILQNNLEMLYDAVTHRPLGDPVESVDSAFLSTAFSPDSGRFATATTSGRVIQWKTEDRREIEPPLEGDVGAIAGVAYSPDGKLLATTRLGFSTTQLWKADNGAQFAGTFVAGRTPFTERTFNIDHFVASRPAFSPKGDRLVTPGFEHATVSWTLRPEAWRRAACAIAGRNLIKAEWNQFLPGRTPRELCKGN
jgi:WD40 repeat protein